MAIRAIAATPRRLPNALPNSGMLPAQVPRGTVQVVPNQPAKKPTFAPPQTGIRPTQAIASQPDPRIAELTQTLQQPIAPVPVDDPRIRNLMSELEQQITTSRNDQTGLRARIAGLPSGATATSESEQLNALIAELMKGKAPDIGDIQADPEAVAYRIASQREAGRAREEAANRQAASGPVTGGGGFDARVAGIRERTGENIAGFEAGLAGRRRGEALDTATRGAQFQMSELQRRQEAERAGRADELNRLSLELSAGEGNAAQLTSLYGSLAAQEESGRNFQQRQAESERSSEQALLAALLPEQARVQGMDITRSLESERIAQERERLDREAEAFKMQQEDRLRARRSSGRGRGPRGGAVGA